MKYSDKQIEDYLDAIYNGKTTPRKLDKELYFAIADYFKRGLYEGFGGNLGDFEGKDLAMLEELRYNCYLFAGAKNYQLTSALHEQMFDEEGGMITKKEFQELGAATFDLWNNDWGKTEYNTTVAQADNAAKWSAIEKDKDVLPYLRYSAIVDEATAEICLEMNDTVARVDDPIWNNYAPVNHYNCRCILIQEAEAEPNVDERMDDIEEAAQGMNEAFKFNPGKTQQIWDKDHPYFDVPKADKAYAKRNFDLPIPITDE